MMKVPTGFKTRPGGVTALSIFFLAATAISTVASVSLLFPESTALTSIWQVNPPGYEAFLQMGGWGIALLWVLGFACLSAAIGLWKGRRWGYYLAISIFIFNLLGDVANILLAGEYKAIVGIPIVLAIFVFLRSRRVRCFFSE